MKRLDSVATPQAPRGPAVQKMEAPKATGQKIATARTGRLLSTKVHERHLARLAIVYVRQSTPLLRRSHLLPGRTEKTELGPGEWLLADLARELDIGCSHLRRWMHRKGVHWRRSPLRGYYIIWADADERKRLLKLQAFFHAHPSLSTALYPKELITPSRNHQKAATENR